MSQPLLAVDAPSLLYRAFFAMPATIVDRHGRPTGALLGAFNMIFRVVAQHRPRAVALCYGPDAADYRVDLYPPYHAQRPPMPAELAWQFEDAEAFFGAFGWQSYADASLEADDVLGSYARIEQEAGGRALILTGDRDLFQCVTDSVLVLYLRTGVSGVEQIDGDEVRRRYGVPPALVPDFIALRGDPSDGLPGASGVGEKTAAALLSEYGSLEATLAAWARIRPPRVAGALRDGRALLERFKDIATLRQIELERPEDRSTDLEGGARAARERGMEQLARRLDGERSGGDTV